MRRHPKRWAHTRCVIVVRRHKTPCKEIVRKYLQDYCENTTIHGFKYIGEKGRLIVDRLWWLIVFIICMVGSAYFINKVWRQWHDSPIIMSFAETTTPVWQIPFPTVTICSETKSRESVFNFTKAWFSSNLSEAEEKIRGDISLMCEKHVITSGPNFTDESTIYVIAAVAPQLDDIIGICKWEMHLANCSKLFTPQLTEEGMCFSFNILNSMERYREEVVQSEYNSSKVRTELQWSLEKGYDSSARLETEPLRTFGAGALTGISLLLKANEQDQNVVCFGTVQGFKIVLHNPEEIPKLQERYIRLQLEQDMVISVKPNMILTSGGLLGYPPRSRRCYFQSERHLAYFKVYTQRNCELECLTNYTLIKCQCAAVYMPRLESTQLCGAGSKRCVNEAIAELNTEKIMFSMKKSETLENTCDCLPACTSLQYDAEVSQVDFNWRKMLNMYVENGSAYDGFEGLQLSRLDIYFKDTEFISSRRIEQYSVADFLAICGGLLGLFSGISIMSFIEIIYYVILRIYANMKSQKESTENVSADHHNNRDLF